MTSNLPQSKLSPEHLKFKENQIMVFELLTSAPLSGAQKVFVNEEFDRFIQNAINLTIVYDFKNLGLDSSEVFQHKIHQMIKSDCEYSDRSVNIGLYFNASYYNEVIKDKSQKYTFVYLNSYKSKIKYALLKLFTNTTKKEYESNINARIQLHAQKMLMDTAYSLLFEHFAISNFQAKTQTWAEKMLQKISSNDLEPIVYFETNEPHQSQE